MEASSIDIVEKVPASRKLQADDARKLLTDVGQLIVAKGKKVNQFDGKALATDAAVAAMLGPTGNLRAPTIRTGKTLIVGYNEGAFQGLFN